MTVLDFQVVNFYVALKSKPIVILAGPKNSGKCQLVKRVGRALTEDTLSQFQTMSGHAWWAAPSENFIEFSRMQERFIAEKTKALFYEVCHSKNFERPFILAINRISPAELEGIFADLVSYLQNGKIPQGSSPIFSIPSPFPPNLHVIGTMDTSLFNWFDNNALLTHATVIHWIEHERISSDRFPDHLPHLIESNSFSTSRIFHPRDAEKKLHDILPWRQHIQPILIELLGWLVKHGGQLPTRLVMDEAALYLANAFTEQRVGLFVPNAYKNLRIALDFVLAQIVLPRAWKNLTLSSFMQEVISDQLGEGFPQTHWMLEQSVKG